MPAEPGTTHEPEPGTAPKPATNARETGSLTVGSPNREEPSGTWRRRQSSSRSQDELCSLGESANQLPRTVN